MTLTRRGSLITETLQRISLKGLPRSAWLELRRGGIGGSDAAAILGISPYRTPADVWLEKLGLSEGQAESERMVRGRMVESQAALRFRALEHLSYRTPRELLISEAHGFPQVATLDRIVYERGTPGVLELKDVGDWAARAWEAGVPEHYRAQIDHYLAVTGYGFAWVAGWVGSEFFRERCERDEERIGRLVAAERRFWQEHVVAVQPPEPDETLAYAELLDAVYPEGDAGAVELPCEAEDWLCRRAEAKREIARLESCVRECDNHLKSLLGAHEEGGCGSWTVSWKTHHRGGYAVAPKTYRQLLVKGPTVE
jgi:putative phage-type endonuclease